MSQDADACGPLAELVPALCGASVVGHSVQWPRVEVPTSHPEIPEKESEKRKPKSCFLLWLLVRLRRIGRQAHVRSSWPFTPKLETQPHAFPLGLERDAPRAPLMF